VEEEAMRLDEFHHESQDLGIEAIASRSSRIQAKPT
jgi:hypothetical protein